VKVYYHLRLVKLTRTFCLFHCFRPPSLVSLLARTEVLLGLVEVAGCLAESNKGEVYEALCIPQMLWLCLLPLLHSCLVTPLVEHPHANAEQGLIRLVRDQPYSRLFLSGSSIVVLGNKSIHSHTCVPY